MPSVGQSITKMTGAHRVRRLLNCPAGRAGAKIESDDKRVWCQASSVRNGLAGGGPWGRVFR